MFEFPYVPMFAFFGFIVVLNCSKLRLILPSPEENQDAGNILCFDAIPWPLTAGLCRLGRICGHCIIPRSERTSFGSLSILKG